MKYGRYDIIGELGKGAMGMVYRAHDPQIDRMIALKVLRPDRVTSEEFVQRFLKEAKAIGRLSHPSIVTVYDVGQDQGTIYIAMEFLEGSPLNELIQEKNLSLIEIVDISVQIAEALDYAHQHGIVHRDIKPANIILTQTGQAKITDFGIARIEDPSATQQTQAGTILGTPSYMSPEQALGMPIDGRSDLYSLGVILYELTTGNKPFSGDNFAATLRAITQDTPIEPLKATPTIPPTLSEFIMKCLNKQPEDRFQTGQEMAKSLKGCLMQTESETVFEPPPQATVKAIKHRNIYVFIALIVVTVAMLLGYYLLIRPPAQSPQPKTEMPVSEEITMTQERVKEQAPAKVEPPPVVETETAVPDKAPVTQEKAKVQAPATVEPPPVVETETAVPDKAPIIQEKVEEQAPATVEPPPVIETEPIIQAFLKVDSVPSGARVFLNGSSKGETPLNLKLPMGDHEVRLSLNNYHDWEARLQLDEEGEVPLFIRLIPLAERSP